MTNQPSSADQVEAALADLIDLHDLGRESLEAYPGNLPHGATGDLAAEAGVTPEVLRHSRRFASPALGGYSARDRERLFGRCRRFRCAVSLTNVRKLLTIEDPAVRSDLELAMIKGRWSRRRLDDEIRMRLGNRKQHAGRKPRGVRNLREAALQASRAATQATRVLDQLDPAEKDQGRPPVPLPKKLSRQIRQAREALAHLRDVADQILTSERDTEGLGADE